MTGLSKARQDQPMIFKGRRSYHEGQVAIPDTITHVEVAMDSCVAAVVGVKSWPQLALEGRDGASDIRLDAPRAFREVFCDAIEAIIVVSCFVSIDQ